MSIPILNQVYDEVRRLSIAGSAVAPGDFRLKKLMPPLEQSGQKTPVFAKVAQAIGKLVESTEKTSAEALLELSTLVNAVLYTQGETGLAGALSPIPTNDLGQQQTQISARILKPLLEALTSTGSGRLEIIKDALERGVFRDLRLVGPALAALDDPYPEIADLIAQEVLTMYGKAILPELRAAFDIRGRGGHERRLALMHNIDPEGSRDFVKRALEDGSKEMRVIAISCLGSSSEDLSFLLEQSRSKAKDVRRAALNALGRCDADEAAKTLCAELEGGDIELAISPVQTSRNPLVLEFVLVQARDQFNTLLSEKTKDKAKLGKQARRMLALLQCLRGREDQAVEQFLLDMFAQREKLAALKGEPSGKDVEHRLVVTMAASSNKTRDILIGAHAGLLEDQLAVAFAAALQTRGPTEVFVLFGPYLTAKVDQKKKERDSVWRKREALAGVLTSSWPMEYSERPGTHELAGKLDPRWLDLAVDHEHEELVLALARPGHAKANALLAKVFENRLKKVKTSYGLTEILNAMVRVKHPQATDALIASIDKYAKLPHNYYSLYWIAKPIADLPKESLPKLEAWLPTLPEKAIDQVLGFVTQLRNRA
jgi:hypothetical protein